LTPPDDSAAQPRCEPALSKATGASFLSSVLYFWFHYSCLTRSWSLFCRVANRLSLYEDG